MQMMIQKLIKKKDSLLIILFSITSIFYSFKEWDRTLNEFCRVEIYSGYTIFGTNCLKLSEEGLLMKENDFSKINSQIKFIRFDKLDRVKVFKLQNYLIRENYFINYDSIISKEVRPSCSTPDIFVIRKTNSTFKKIKCYIDDYEPLDSLIYYMNGLIPVKYQKKFRINLGNKYYPSKK
jgi:hypothetical protein